MLLGVVVKTNINPFNEKFQKSFFVLVGLRFHIFQIGLKLRNGVQPSLTVSHFLGSPSG